jgi:hypothetical protein
MDAAQIQAKVYFGYAKAAQYVGLPFNQFRPAGPSNPTAGSPLQGLNAQFTVGPSGFNFDKAPGFKDAAFNALLDGTQTQVGDYLVGASDTYYVASQEPLLPIPDTLRSRTRQGLRRRHELWWHLPGQRDRGDDRVARFGAVRRPRPGDRSGAADRPAEPVLHHPSSSPGRGRCADLDVHHR